MDSIDLIEKSNIHFKNDYRLERFLTCDTNNIFSVQTLDAELELVRIRDVLRQLQDSPGKSVDKYVGAENGVLLQWADLKMLLDEADTKYSRLSNLTVVSFLNCKSLGAEGELVLNQLLWFLVGQDTKKLILVFTAKDVLLDLNGLFKGFDADSLLKHVVPTKLCFRHLTNETQEYLLQNPCIFYQDKSMSLKEFLYINDIADVRLNNIINSAFLRRILLQQDQLLQININSDILPNTEFCICRRFFSEIFMSYEIANLLTGQCEIPDDFFIFGGSINCKEKLVEILNVPEELSHKILNNENIHVVQDLESSVVEERPSDTTVHFINCDSDNTLSWISSKGPIDNIRKFAIIENREAINEDLLYKKKVAVLSGPPGIGKSTSLAKLRLYQPSAWIITIDLSQCEQAIRELRVPITQRSVIYFISSLIDDQPLVKGMLRDALFSHKSRPLYLLIDEFDEMAEVTDSNSIHCVIAMLQYIRNNSKASIWITSRPQTTAVLENALSVFGTRFAAIDSIEQKKYFYTIWSVNCVSNEDHLLRQYVEDFYETIQTFFKGKMNLLGVPLLLKMLAVIAGPHVERTPNFVNISDIFRTFIEQRYQIFLESTGLPSQETVDHLNRQHGQLALLNLFPDCRNVLQSDVIDIAKVKLVWPTKDGALTFTHRIFAEYFVADWIGRWLENSDNSPVEEIVVSRILLEPQYNIIRLFLDQRLNKEIPVMHQGIIERLAELWIQKKNVFFNDNQEWALHILIDENLSRIALVFLQDDFLRRNIELFTSRNKEGKTALFLAAERKDENLVDAILDKFDSLPDVYSRSLFWATLLGMQRCDGVRNLIAKLKSRPGFTLLPQKLEQHNALREACFNFVRENKLVDLQRCINAMEDDVARTYLLQTSCNTNGTMLHLAASLGLLDLAAYFLDSDMPVDVLDFISATPLHYAASNGNLDVVKLLMSRDAKVNLRDEHSRTALLHCAENGHLEVVLVLIKDGFADVEAYDKNGMSALEHAAKSGHTATVEALVNNGCHVNHRDEFGMSALTWAVKEGHYETVSCLVCCGADLHIKDRHGLNLINVAVKAKHCHIVKYLTFCMVDLNDPDINGVTPLERAVKSSLWDIVEHLILEGASLDCNGFNPIIYAMKANEWCLAILMVEREAELHGLSYAEKSEILDQVIISTDDIYRRFYIVVRLGNVELLELLIHREKLDDISKVTDLDALLARPYEELLLRNVAIREHMKWFVEGKLVEIRSATEQNVELSFNDVKERLRLISKEIRNLEISKFSGKETKKVDTEFIVRSRFISQYIEVIKRTKFLKNTGIPLEQMEFCLLIFINFFVKPVKDDFSYRLILDQDRIMMYLSYFADTIDSYLNNPSSKNVAHLEDSLSKFVEPLEDDYRLIKDIYSLQRISSYITLALSIKDNDNVINPLVLMRCLQVIGESLNDRNEPPNLSRDIHEYLLYRAPIDIKDILISLRHLLSHSHSLIERAEIEEQLKRDNNYFHRVQNDLKKIKSEIDFLIYVKKLECLDLFFKKSEQCLSEPYHLGRLNWYIDWTSQEVMNRENYEYEELKIIKSLVSKLNKLTQKRSKNEKELARYLQDEIVEIEEYIFDRINTAKLKYADTQRSIFLSMATKFPVTLDSPAIKYPKTPGNLYQDAINIVTEFIQIYDYKENSEEDHKLSSILHKLHYLMQFEVNKIKNIKKFQNSLTPRIEKENIRSFHFIFETIRNMLENEDDKTQLDVHIAGQFNIYNVSQKLKLATNTITLQDIKELAVEKAKKRTLIDCLKKKDLKKLGSTLGPTNLIGKLLRNFNAKEFDDILRDFCAPLKNTNIANATNRFIEEQWQKVKEISTRKLAILRNLPAIMQDLENHPAQAAIEMLLLDVLEVLDTKGFIPKYTLTFDEFAPVLVNKALRNYLAHGNLLMDTLPFEPLKAIFSSVKLLSRPGPNLLSTEGISSTVSHSLIKCETKLKLDTSILNDHLSHFIDLDKKTHHERDARDLSGLRMLHYAILNDHVFLFQSLYTNRCYNLSICFASAAEKGAINVLRYILDNILATRKIINIKNQAIPLSPLSLAAQNGHETVVQLLLDCGVNPNETDGDQITPLYNAAYGGHEAVVKQLLNNGAVVNAAGNRQLTEIFAAALKGSEAVVKLLLDHGADIDVASESHITPLFVATSGEHEAVVKLLLEHGADANTANLYNNTPLFISAAKGQTSMVKQLLDHGAKINMVNDDNLTALDIAVARGHTPVVKLLLKSGAHVHKTTLLHRAAMHGHVSVVQELLELPMDVNALALHEVTPLYAAASNGHAPVIELLLKNHAHINAADKYQTTPLCIAVLNGHESAVVQLLEHGADINVLTINQVTALSIAAQKGHGSIVKLILEKIKSDTDVSTALRVAAFSGHTSIVKQLLEHITNIDATEKDQKTALHEAALNGHDSIIKLLLESGGNIDARDEDLNTPLILAATQGHRLAVEVLLKKGADVNAANDQKNTPLLIAASNGHEFIVKQLLTVKAVNVDASNKNQITPLMAAAGNGHESIVEQLLDHGVDINVVDQNQVTPLRIAAACNHEAVVKLLLQRGAKFDAADNYQVTPIHAAATYGYETIVKVLLEHGADIEIPDINGCTPLKTSAANNHLAVVKQLLQHEALVNAPDNDKITSLHEAASNGHEAVVKELLEYGADVNTIEENGCTPLILAATNGHESVVIQLLNHHAASTKYHTSALHIASVNGHELVVKRLLEHNINVNATDEDEVTALNLAAVSGHLSVIKLLLDHGADVNAADKYQITPLYAAAKQGYEAVVELLLDHGVDAINIVATNQSTPLHAAATNGHQAVVKLLLDHGADVNAAPDLATPLIIAAEKGYGLIVNLLLDRGATINAANKYQQNSLYVAAQNGHEAVVVQLLQRGADVNAADKDLVTPLNIAVANGHESVVNQLYTKVLKEDLSVSLIIAASNGYESIVKQLLQYGVDVNSSTEDQITSLYEAAAHGHESIVTELIQRGALINASDINKATPLYVAAAHGHATIVRDLLNNGANVNAKTNAQNTPLYAAAANGHASIIEQLIERKADINAADENQITPLIIAATSNHKSVIEQLLRYGARTEAVTKNGFTALYVAVKCGHETVVKQLLDSNNAQVNAADIEGNTPLVIAIANGHDSIIKQLLDYGADTNLATQDNITPLYTAAAKGSESVVKQLLEHQANVNIADTNQITPLYIAATNGHELIVEHLLLHQANIEAVTTEKFTPLYAAAKNGHEIIVTKLLNHGADVNAADNDQNTPLCAAAGHGHVSVVKVLLEHHAPINTTRMIFTPLSLAAANGHESVVKQLLEGGADANIPTQSNATSLFLAVANGHEAVIDCLLKYNADPNIRTANQIGPLHMAAFNGQESVVKQLLDHNADVNILDANQNDPLFYAIRGGHVNVVKLLQEHTPQ